MKPSISEEHEKEGQQRLDDTNNNAEESINPSFSSSTTIPSTIVSLQPCEILWPRPSFLSRRPSVRRTTLSSERAQKISKKKKEQPLNSAFLYFALLLTQQIFVQPVKNHLINSNNFNLQDSTDTASDYLYPTFEELNTKMYSYERTEQFNDGTSREMFDPVGGKYQYDQNDFFAPRFRWRNDAELASFAWNQQEKSQINMMMTENRVPSYGPTTSDKATCGSSCAPRDPSLMDYDAIDVSWRNDIEREKSRPSEYAPQQRDGYDSQYERDLQVLHEKGYISPFTSEEATRYEELSKAQFADFYRTVAAPSKSSSFGQSSRLTNYSSTVPSTSVFRQSYGMDNQEDSQHSSDCQRSDDGYSNDSGFGSNADEDRNGQENINNGEIYYSILEDVPQPQQHFENITIAYEPYTAEENVIIPQQDSSNIQSSSAIPSSSDELSPVLGHYTENGPETLETSLLLDEDEYLKYVTNQQVLEDISASATEQSYGAADEVLERVQRQHENANVTVDFTPFDEPIPFLDDDFFLNLNVNETIVNEIAASLPSEASSSVSRSVSPTHEYRLFGKLAPELKYENDENELDEYDEDEENQSSENKNHRRRGRQSKDNDLVKKHELPATAEELAAMSHKALQALLKDPMLNEVQKSLIKRIRRRGRNKEAARKCRERRIFPSSSSSVPQTIYEHQASASPTITSTPKIIHRPFIVYPPTRITKVA